MNILEEIFGLIDGAKIDHGGDPHRVAVKGRNPSYLITSDTAPPYDEVSVVVHEEDWKGKDPRIRADFHNASPESIAAFAAEYLKED
jgi:hypothetical protein